MAQTTSSTAVELAPVAPAPLSTAFSIELHSLHDDHLGPDSAENGQILGPLARAQDQGFAYSKGKVAVIISCVSVATGINSILSGLIIVSIPVIAREIHLEGALVLWIQNHMAKGGARRPITIQALTCGCTLLLAGSFADVLGSRNVYLLGSFLQTVTSLACGLSKTGAQLIVFRAFSGIATSCSLPSAVSIINDAFVPGRSRNLAFAAMGGGQPVGFGLGLTVGGVLAGSIGWQWAFHMTAILNFITLSLSAWQLPRTVGAVEEVSWTRLKTDIDWLGAIIASSSLAMLSYVLAAVTSDTSSMRQPVNIALLSTAIALCPAFILWMNRQEKLARPALIPNSLWRNKVFTSICINVFLVWGAFNSVEQFGNLFFQEVQRLNALNAAIRFLPMPVIGFIATVLVGLFVHRVRADVIVIVSTIISCVSPVLMALVNPKWSYWACAFPALLFNPIGADGLFTVSNLLISASFSKKTQGLAGGVFNTISQVGKSVGLALATLIANDVTATSEINDKETPQALMKGYRAAFWFLFAVNAVSLFTSVWGLRKIGTVGRKRD
ncbi:MAG: hypothetical protein Q9190_001241 [Brigantiaea leucoxantha]